MKIYGKKYARGTTLIELLIYMTLLGMLMYSVFSIAFRFDSDASSVEGLVDRQYLSLALSERVRNISMKASSVQSPSFLSTSTKLLTDQGSLITDSETSSFSRPFDNILLINFDLLLHGTSTRDYSIPVVLQ